MAEEDLQLKRTKAYRPKPNVIKIQVLDGDERKKYLVSDLQKAGDSIKETISKQLKSDGDDVFYGFIKNSTGNQSLKIGAHWENDKDGGGVLGTMKKIGRDLAGDTVVKLADHVGNLAHDLTGVSATSTGSSSLRRYQGVDIEGFDVVCGWYLPEQLLLCRKSLKTLNRMIYPLQLGSTDARDALNTFIAGPEVSEAITKAAYGSNDNIERDVLTTDEDGEDKYSKVIVSAGKSIKEKVSEYGGDVIDAINTANEFFGRNLTFDPLPVRLWVGHYMDIEPLVINKMDISFSKETFRTYDGKNDSSDMPIFCTVTLSFSYWMNPAPKMEFMNLIGTEMFGESFDPASVTRDEEDLRLRKLSQLGGAYGGANTFTGTYSGGGRYEKVDDGIRKVND
jgi:hypothetical protein